MMLKQIATQPHIAHFLLNHIPIVGIKKISVAIAPYTNHKVLSDELLYSFNIDVTPFILSIMATKMKNDVINNFSKNFLFILLLYYTKYIFLVNLIYHNRGPERNPAPCFATVSKLCPTQCRYGRLLSVLLGNGRYIRKTPFLTIPRDSKTSGCRMGHAL